MTRSAFFAEAAAHHYGGAVARTLVECVPYSVDVALVWECHGLCLPTFYRRFRRRCDRTEPTLVCRFRLVFACVWRRVDGFGFQDVFGITGHRFLLFDGAVDGAKVGSAALLGNGLGHGAHCDGGGAEPSYGEEPLDELASEAGREVEPRCGDSRGAAGRPCLGGRARWGS